jgi:hypothetical protein
VRTEIGCLEAEQLGISFDDIANRLIGEALRAEAPKVGQFAASPNLRAILGKVAPNFDLR